jgi:hypothetical protein
MVADNPADGRAFATSARHDTGRLREGTFAQDFAGTRKK